jgi:hypothetical protein
MTKTTPADLKRINAMFDRMQDPVSSLFSRWQDEAKYEDIANYGKAIANRLPKGFSLTKMTKRPFGFEFSIGNGALYAMQATSRQISWKRVA